MINKYEYVAGLVKTIIDRSYTCIYDNSTGFKKRQFETSLPNNRMTYVPTTFASFVSNSCRIQATFGKRNVTAVLCKQIKQNSDQQGEYCTPGS